MNTLFLFLLAFSIPLIPLSARAEPPAGEESCPFTLGSSCSERDLNAPVRGEAGRMHFESVPSDPRVDYRLPVFDPAWGISRELFERARGRYEAIHSQIRNRRYFTIVDFSKRSSRKRFFLFDLENGKVEKHLTSHGRNSDADGDGYATRFSNVPESKMSSLGLYLTLGTYQGGHGLSLRLRGLDPTNSNAEARAIVMHPAKYVNETKQHAGRSWGCPALDPKVAKSVINRVKGGSLLYIDR